MENNWTREFDSEDRYEKEKVTRIMPENLKRFGFYTLRIMSPPEVRGPFGTEFTVCIRSVDQFEPDYHEVSLVMKPIDKPEIFDSKFNQNGFMIIEADEEVPEETEIGYIVGSLDPYDIEFAEMIAKAQESAIN